MAEQNLSTETSTVKTIPIENSLFKINGAIGRGWFFLNTIFIFLMSCLLFIVTAKPCYYIAHTYKTAGYISLFIAAICFLVFEVINIGKRIVDIKGNEDKIAFWTLCAVGVFFIPGVNKFFGYYLIFANGLISNNSNKDNDKTNAINEYMNAHPNISSIVLTTKDFTSAEIEEFPSDVKYCESCACEIPSDAAICPECGHDFREFKLKEL